MTNPDNLNTDLDQAALETVRTFFNRPSQPGTQLNNVQVGIAKALITTDALDLGLQAADLDNHPHRPNRRTHDQ